MTERSHPCIVCESTGYCQDDSGSQLADPNPTCPYWKKHNGMIMTIEEYSSQFEDYYYEDDGQPSELDERLDYDPDC